jgi:ribosomal-protein-alanine N-acetyltransferase
MEVTPVREADLDRILEIERHSFGKDAYPRKLFAEYLRRCGSLFLVARLARSRSHAAVVAYMITCIRGNAGELISVAVAPEARRQGAASQLMDSTLRRLRRRGIPRMVLMVRIRNRAARAFYQKYGFEKRRRVPGYYEDGADAWLMELRINSQARST